MKLRYLFCALCAAATIGVGAQVYQMDADINVIPDKVIKTDQGVRVSLCLVGIPNTSQRIDSVALVLPPNGVRVMANDVDGVDFERVFQFEEEGAIMIDLDFAAPAKMPLHKDAVVTLYTSHGPITAPARP